MKWLALVLAAGCAGRTGEIITDPGDLSEASRAPRIDVVEELGGGDVVLTAPVRPQRGDGVATVGEALWVRGSSFGRRPTVTIAGRPAAILARTTDGGLVVRVPPAAPVGAQPLTIVNDQGQGERQLTVRRLAAVLPPRGGRLALADLAAAGPRPVGDLPAAGQLLSVGADGRAAYVVDVTTARLIVFELPAQGGPREAFQMDLPLGKGAAQVAAFGAASLAPVLMVVGSTDLMLLDATAALRPVRGQLRPLPPAVKTGGMAAAVLSPDGRMAAVVLEEGNRVALLDLRQAGAAPLIAELGLAPDVRVPVVVDVVFAPDGRTLWVALGDTAKSRAVGPQPTEIVAVRVDIPGPSASSAPGAVLSVARRVRIEEAQAPVRLNTGRAIPLASGASIRLPPERATVYLTAANRGGAATVFRLGAEDGAAPFVAVRGTAGAGDLSPDGRWLLVPAVLSRGGAFSDGTGRLAIIAAPADARPGAPVIVEMGAAPEGATPGTTAPPTVSGVGTEPRPVFPSVAAQP